MPKLTNIHNNISLEFKLLKNELFDVKTERADFENWIPFEFELCIEGKEKYTYTKEHGVTFSLEDIRRLISGLGVIINEKSQNVEIRRFIWGPTEYYFSMHLYETYEENVINVELWITVGELTKGESFGYDRGFKFEVSIDALKCFINEFKEQVTYLVFS